ncbi:hypothetical protein BD770DRAFT_78670 [Pilaira anomala]|nr:hypothetical protein BD770DRAFT_78670 [Pilaira anomala]
MTLFRIMRGCCGCGLKVIFFSFSFKMRLVRAWFREISIKWYNHLSWCFSIKGVWFSSCSLSLMALFLMALFLMALFLMAFFIFWLIFVKDVKEYTCTFLFINYLSLYSFKHVVIYF